VIGQFFMHAACALMVHYFREPTSRLPTLQLTIATHSSRCLETFHCSSAVSSWSIATWANGSHS